MATLGVILCTSFAQIHLYSKFWPLVPEAIFIDNSDWVLILF